MKVCGSAVLGFLSLVVGLAQWVLGRTMSESVFGQWCAVHGLMVNTVSLSLWPMVCSAWSDGEDCQSVPLANGLQWTVWWWRLSESVFSQWLTMNGLMVKSVRICLWPMACNEWSDGEECQSVPLANGVQCMVWWWRVSVCPFGQWLTMNGLMVKSVSLSLWPMAYNEWSDGEECQSLSLANVLQSVSYTHLRAH